jgi:hypothetical protein
MAARGFRYHERNVGTNALGTALEQRAPFLVLGSEHFADALTHMACAAAPIIDPATASVLGVIDLTCSVEGSHSLMLAVAKGAARDIEQRIVPGNGRATSAFRNRVAWLWRRALRRRSQRSRLPWARMSRLVTRWLPTARISHPFPEVSLRCQYPRQEPSALVALAGIRAGGPYRDRGPRSPSWRAPFSPSRV